MIIWLGVVIGLDRSSYTVAENAGSVRVCASVQTAVGMEPNTEYSATMQTVVDGEL